MALAKPETKREFKKNDGVPYKVKTVHSFGIICFRRDVNNKYFSLLVRRRVSYEFSEIMSCRHSVKELPNAIFYRLPTAERLLLLTLDFYLLWYHLTLRKNTNDKDYQHKNELFKQAFLHDDGRALLAKLNEVHSSINTEVWSPPHGRRKIYTKNKIETELECAVREFQEETGIDKKAIKIFPDIARTLAFEDCGIRYVEKFFLAITLDSNTMPRMFMNQHNVLQPQEIIEIKWVPLEDISRVCRKEIRACKHFNGLIHALFKAYVRNVISIRMPRAKKMRIFSRRDVIVTRKLEVTIVKK